MSPCICGLPHCGCGSWPDYSPSNLSDEQREELLQQEWQSLLRIDMGVSDEITHYDGSGREYRERRPDAWELK